jgi:DNA-binding transcriptional MerR regulator
MADSQLVTPHTAAQQLNISLNQLKRWTKEFAAQLSASAVSSGQYRYSPDDVKKLHAIKEWLTQGKSKADVAKQLAGAASNHHHHDSAAPAIVTADEHEQAVVSAQNQASLVLGEMLQGFAAGQEAILNSQQTNRSLLGVVIQDNFNLKEENTRLRERMLKLEQDLNDLRAQQQDERYLLELRFQQLEQKKDWLNRLLGI